MGFFTWTDAKRTPRLLKNGDYASVDKIKYGSRVKVICPDNTMIVEPCYDGYGMFDQYDIYELVVDWNKDHLDEIFKNLAAKNPIHWGYTLADIAHAYAINEPDDKILSMAAQKVRSDDAYLIIKDEWKRVIGIAISAGDQNADLPYPIKMTSSSRIKSMTYNDFVPSMLCQ